MKSLCRLLKKSSSTFPDSSAYSFTTPAFHQPQLHHLCLNSLAAHNKLSQTCQLVDLCSALRDSIYWVTPSVFLPHIIYFNGEMIQRS